MHTRKPGWIIPAGKCDKTGGNQLFLTPFDGHIVIARVRDLWHLSAE